MQIFCKIYLLKLKLIQRRCQEFPISTMLPLMTWIKLEWENQELVGLWKQLRNAKIKSAIKTWSRKLFHRLLVNRNPRLR